MMTDLLSSIGPAVGNHLWQTSAFATLVWLATLLLRRNQARVRYALWLAASLKFLLPFSLLVGLGGLLPRPQREVVTMPVYSAVDSAALPFSQMPAEAAPVAVHLSRTQRFIHDLPLLLLAVWLCGAVVVLAAWCIRWRQVARTLRRAVRMEDGREADLLRRVEHAMAGRGRTRSLPAISHAPPIPLLLSRELMEPGIFGIFRPVLIWPERLSERLDDEHIAAILAHELMHVRRHDNLTAALHMAVEAAFWFHPIVWWMGRRMVEERERACDEAVVEMGSRPGIYAESLLKAVRFCVESPLPCVAGITGADLTRRVRSIMTLRLRRLSWVGKTALAVLGVAAIATPLIFGIMNAPLRAQSADQDWMKTAGGKQEFEVASVRENKTGGKSYSNFSLDNGNAYFIVNKGDTFAPSGTLFQATNQTPMRYILFAYKLGGTQELALRFKYWAGLSTNVPSWVNNTLFDIEARAPRPVTKDQMRLMMQSLLAERFKLAVHKETRQVPVFAMVLEKPGTMGPQLRVHPASDSCATTTFPESASDTGAKKGAASVSQTLPIPCGMIAHLPPSAPGLHRIGGRNVTLAMLAESLPPQTGLAVLPKPVIDRTGLGGIFDFSLEWAQPVTSSDIGPGPNTQGEESGPSFAQAMKEQLGLKLESTKGPVELLVIDHIERPSPN